MRAWREGAERDSEMKRTSKKRPGVGLLAFGEGCHGSLVLVAS